MKQILTANARIGVTTSILKWVLALFILFQPIPVPAENSVADEIVSLNATGQPLGEVLRNISAAARCRFSIDGSWEDFPITAAFDNEPLHRGLKLIFRNINNAVIYGEDRTVKIVIYDRGPDSGASDGQSITIKSSPEFITQNQPFSEATAPQPEEEIADDDSSPESLLREDEAEAETGTKTEGAEEVSSPADEELSDASGEHEEPTE